jgi:hypothetical protein
MWMLSLSGFGAVGGLVCTECVIALAHSHLQKLDPEDGKTKTGADRAFS